MKLPLSFLRSYLPLNEPLPVICETLTLLGIEVDGIENETPRFSNVVAAEILSSRPHPSSDHLSIAQVSDGSRQLTIVCGAANCRPGIKTALAPIGATLYDEQHRKRAIAETVVRGVSSQGMLCSAAELGIPGSADGILELPLDLPNGQDLAPFLCDPVLELSLTPNLGHCFSALGVARELAAGLHQKLRQPKIELRDNEASRLQDRIKVSVRNPELCPRYMCRMIEQIQIGPSPFWLQQILFACGMRPINNVVDITNYILLKTGQPLHAFDFDRIDGSAIVVQANPQPQLFVCIDGVERNLPAGALLICNARRPMAIAGIMGGVDSSVVEKTRTIVLEAACFDSLSIRKTARSLKLSTESSQRFEKGIDIQGVDAALDEACHLIAQLCRGQIAGGTIDIKAHEFTAKKSHLRPDRANKILGTQLSLNEIEDCLRRIGCKTESVQDGQSLQVAIPSFRNDIVEEVDLIEEIARIYGYNNIDKKTPVCTTSRIPWDPVYLFERDVRRRLAGLGLQEIITCNLISPKLAELLPAKSSFFKVLHSKSDDYSILRPSLLPGLLETVKFNLDQKNASLSAFEIGRIHLKQNHSPVEIPMLGIVLFGKNRPHHWDRKPQDVDFYDLKGIIESLVEGLSVSSILFRQTALDSFHPNRQAGLHIDGLTIGSLGEVHPLLLAKLDIKPRVYYAEIDLAYLLKLKKSHSLCQPLPLYPSTERDWTISLPPRLQYEMLIQAIRSFQSPLLEKAELIDMYREEANSVHNATIRFTYRDPLKTISFEEAEAVHAKLMAHVLKSVDSMTLLR